MKKDKSVSSYERENRKKVIELGNNCQKATLSASQRFMKLTSGLTISRLQALSILAVASITGHFNLSQVRMCCRHRIDLYSLRATSSFRCHQLVKNYFFLPQHTKNVATARDSS